MEAMHRDQEKQEFHEPGQGLTTPLGLDPCV